MSSENQKVWFITGCSTGFGRELAKQLLESNQRVAVTARDAGRLEGLVQINPENALAVTLDVTDAAQVKDAVAKAEAHFGRIDVLINNAGFGYFGAIEESDEAEARRMFEANFWGLSAMTREVLPKMRERRTGFIVNISSIGGFVGNPGVGYYNATKFAVNGFSEALAKELKPLGIKVLLIQPSGFRTDWAGRSANEASETIADYRETAEANKNTIRGYSGKQPGDPVRAARTIIEAVESANPPFNLFLGRAALKGARTKLAAVQQDLDAWAEQSENADFPLEDQAQTAK